MQLLTATQFLNKFKNADLSSLPGSNPGSGKPWLNNGFISVGGAVVPANDANVIHTTGNETKTGNLTVTGSLIFDSTYEAVTAGIGGSNAHVGMTYRGTVKAGAFGSAANGFGAGQVALGTITGTSISPQAYVLPNTNGIQVTQGDRTTLGTVQASNLHRGSELANLQLGATLNLGGYGGVEIWQNGTRLSDYGGYNISIYARPVLFRRSIANGAATMASIDCDTGAATFSGNMTFSGSIPRINFTSSGLDTFIQHTAANTIQIGVNNSGRLQIGTAGVRLLDTGGDFGWSDVGIAWESAGAGKNRVYNAGLAAWQDTVRHASSGTGPKISFLGATPITRQTLPGSATDAATTQTLTNAIRQLLIDFGLAA